MKKVSRIVWGVVLVAVGAVLALNALGIADIDLFFDGWWSLFLIIPCAVGLFTERDKTGNLIGLLIGVFLLLCAQDILSFSMLWKIVVPAVIILVGLKLIFGGMFGGKTATIIKQLQAENPTVQPNGFAAFSGQNMNFDGEVFTGAEINAIFGGVKCDVRGAILEKDCVINASAIFGGVDILVPDTVNVVVQSTSIFGGVSDKKRAPKREGIPTVYINATCLFGGVDIK
ncbi:MAG: hypothetical protein IJP14_06960 [Clostridia bacterium]|nr:hypothetical protein [Clostridia bacterium]